MATTQSWAPPATEELATPDGRVLRYCRYGPPAGVPVLSLPGTPSTRWERPDVIEAFERAGLRVVVPDRPGYGGSTPQPDRTVADAAADAVLLADAQGWDRFAVTGFSGGAPHALACAALLPGRVTHCAVVACPAPPDVPGLAPQGEGFRLARLGEEAVRTYLADRARTAVARIEAGGPLLTAEPAAPDQPRAGQAAPDRLAPDRLTPDRPAPDPSGTGQPADPGRPHRIRAMFLDGVDGSAEDHVALVRPWGFDVASITVPVSLWHCEQDPRVPPAHAQWLLSNIPAAQDREYQGGHEPDAPDYQRILSWLADNSA
jgi:pimeloyl-ACP methyl ester carboxylesterase